MTKPDRTFEDYLESLTWDGKKRLDRWLIKYLGAKTSPEVKEAGAKFFLSAVARTYEPGCNVPRSLMLYGEPGTGKSRALAALVDDQWLVDEPTFGSEGASSIASVQGAVIVEVHEMERFTKKQSEEVKTFLVTSVDTYRPPYAKNYKVFPRTCVFVGTTNSDVVDANESRERFWHVKVGKLDVEALRRDRDQLWVEAVVRYKKGEGWN